MEIGEKLTITKNFEIESALGGQKFQVKEGTEVIVCGIAKDDKTLVKFLEGEAKGKISVFPEKVTGVDYENIADYIANDVVANASNQNKKYVKDIILDNLEEFFGCADKYFEE